MSNTTSDSINNIDNTSINKKHKNAKTKSNLDKKIQYLTDNYVSHLKPICKNININNINDISFQDLPIDCQNLVVSMVNITLYHKLTDIEIELFGSRVKYLASQNSDIPYLFIHIPKTGGTSIGEYFEKNIRLLFKKSSQTDRAPDHDSNINRHLFLHYWSTDALKHEYLSQENKQIYMIFGHLPYGFDKLLLNTTLLQQLKKQSKFNKEKNFLIWQNNLNFTYTTVLRNPMRRVESHYWYFKKNPIGPKAKWTIGRTFIEWVEYYDDATECMVAHISGCNRNAWYNREPGFNFDELPMLPRRQQWKKNPNPKHIVKNEHYLIARKNLLEMRWIGIFEKFQQSIKQIEIFFDKFQTKYFLKQLNINKQKPQTKLTQKEIQIVKKYNQFDQMLYDLGLVLFRQQEIVAKYVFGFK